MKKIICIITIGLMFLLAGCQTGADTTPDTDSGAVGIYTFNIGKADAILITTENHTVLIDTGLDKNGDDIAAYLKEQGIVKIDYLIITHFDKDHVGGADIIIEEFSIDQVIMPNYTKDAKQYNQFVEAMEQMELSQTVLIDEMSFTLDDASFTIYPSQMEFRDYSDGNEDESEENNHSLVVRLNHGENNLLFTGDAMASRIDDLLATDEIVNTTYNFLKVPHHGKYNERSEAFISAIQPQYAVITCSEDNPADERIISALEAAGTQVFLTTEGNVYCVSDGTTLTVTYQ